MGPILLPLAFGVLSLLLRGIEAHVTGSTKEREIVHVVAGSIAVGVVGSVAGAYMVSVHPFLCIIGDCGCLDHA